MALGKGLSSLIPVKQKPADARGGTEQDSKKGLENILMVPVVAIIVDPGQPRKKFKEEPLAELAASIREKGILQPLIVSERPDGKYDLLAGERRLRAAKIVGLASVPAVIKNAKNKERLEIALIENIQREDLNVLEEAFAFKRLVEEFGLKLDEIAMRVGKSRSDVSNKIRMLDLPEPVQNALSDGEISPGKARALLGLKDHGEIMSAFKSMIGKTASVREIEEMVAKRKTVTQGEIRRLPRIMDAESKLRDKLKTKVNITGKGDTGKIIIEYYSEEEFDRLLRVLGL